MKHRSFSHSKNVFKPKKKLRPSKKAALPRAHGLTKTLFDSNAIVKSLSPFNPDKASTYSEKKIDALTSQVSLLTSKLIKLEKSFNALRAEVHPWLVASSLDLPAKSIKAHRLVAVRAYLSHDEGNTSNKTLEAIKTFLDAFDLSIIDYYPAIRGSWYKSLYAKSKTTLSKPEIIERLSKIERAIELQILDKPQTDINQKQVGCVKQLLEAVADTPHAAMQIGNILIIKTTRNNESMILSKTLTHKELQFIEENPEIMMAPAKILTKLKTISSKKSMKNGSAIEDESTKEDEINPFVENNPRPKAKGQIADGKRIR